MAVPDGAVICAAAAVADDPHCVEMLRLTPDLVVWLQVPPAVLAARFAQEPHRPVYGADTVAFLTSQAAHREPISARRPDSIVVAGPGSPRAEVEVILAALRG